MSMNIDKLDEAIKHLEAALKPTAAEMKLVSHWDQIKAECRDDSEKRERVIQVLINNGSTREEAEEWLRST